MTKPDSEMEQPTSQLQTSGETDYKSAYNPTDRSPMAELRRAYKKLFGYKPTGMTEDELRSVVENAQSDRQAKEEARTTASKWEDNVPSKYVR